MVDKETIVEETVEPSVDGSEETVEVIESTDVEGTLEETSDVDETESEVSDVDEVIEAEKSEDEGAEGDEEAEGAEGDEEAGPEYGTLLSAEEAAEEVVKAYLPGMLIASDRAVRVYPSSTSAKYTREKRLYVWSSDIMNGRIHVTNSLEKVGVRGKFTGMVDVSDIK